jgi:hypothetical protein
LGQQPQEYGSCRFSCLVPEEQGWLLTGIGSGSEFSMNWFFRVVAKLKVYSLPFLN